MLINQISGAKKLSWQTPKCDTSTCVAVANSRDNVLVGSTLDQRDGKPKDVAKFTRGEFKTFIKAVKDGEYDSYL